MPQVPVDKSENPVLQVVHEVKLEHFKQPGIHGTQVFDIKKYSVSQIEHIPDVMQDLQLAIQEITQAPLLRV